jgi:hypothetical protein
MHAAGISGRQRRKRGKTTISIPGVRIADGLVDRAFAAAAPDRLWVADISYLRAHLGGRASPRRRPRRLRPPNRRLGDEQPHAHRARPPSTSLRRCGGVVLPRRITGRTQQSWRVGVLAPVDPVGCRSSTGRTAAVIGTGATARGGT